MKMIGLIPARSGSKRIPEKNIYPFFGHPLMAYSIASALESKIFSKVVVSTDSERYAEIAGHYGAEVPFLRPEELSGERSTDAEWVEFTLNRLRKQGEDFDAFSLLRPTSPFRNSSTIQRAFERFCAETEADSLRAVEKCGQHPGKMWVLKGNQIVPFVDQDPLDPLHSKPYGVLPPVYVQNASLEMAHTRVIFDDHTIAGRHVIPFFTEGYEGVDINQPYDLWYAEYLVKHEGAVLPNVQAASVLEVKPR